MYFSYDKLINEADFCNSENEKKALFDYIQSGQNVKIFGPRNFGKTSLIKNIVSKKWESQNLDNRVVVYMDFYSIESMDQLSQELTFSFSKALAQKKSLFSKGFDILKSLKNIRPTWEPSLSGDSLGELSLKSEKNEPILSPKVIFENMDLLQQQNRFEFLVILDEFQEIKKIQRAEAILRGVLQDLKSSIPVVILGSKQHILNDIFNKPRAPFYSWGNSIEIGFIEYEKYHEYIMERFKFKGVAISLDVSIYLQNKMNRIPESINRLCDYILKVKQNQNKTIKKTDVDNILKDFISQSRSVYEEIYSRYNANARKVLIAFANFESVKEVTGKEFLARLSDLSKTGVSAIFKKLLDDSTLSYFINSVGEKEYSITDPFLKEFLKQYKIL